MNKNLIIYCVSNRDLEFLKKLDYKLAGVGKDNFSKEYIKSDNLDNIFFKEEHYSELTFHYWFWKNKLNEYIHEDKMWIGFCQKRRFWIQYENLSDFDETNISKFFLKDVPQEWTNFDSIICKPLSVEVSKFSKLVKKGWRNLIRDPSIFFDKKKYRLNNSRS